MKKKIDEIVLKFKKLSRDAGIPEYILGTDVGFDIKSNEFVKIFPMEQKAIKTGIAIEIPEGYVGLVRDRAGVAKDMNVHTAAGTFDSGFRGEISIMLVNLNDKTVVIEKGTRIAQIILIPVVKAKIQEVGKLTETERGEKSFGSSGMKEVLKELDKLYKKGKHK